MKSQSHPIKPRVPYNNDTYFLFLLGTEQNDRRTGAALEESKESLQIHFINGRVTRHKGIK